MVLRCASESRVVFFLFEVCPEFFPENGFQKKYIYIYNNIYIHISILNVNETTNKSFHV